MVPGGSDRNEFREFDPVIGELDRTPVGRAARRPACNDRRVSFAATPQIVGELVVLRPPSEADVAVLHALMRDPEVSVLTGSVHTSTPEIGRCLDA